MSPKILVVEDNSDLLFNIELILKSNKFQPITAKNGKEALKILSQLEEPPDIIISDIMMPELDGYEFFKEILNDPRWNSIPFIFLTAKSTPQDVRLGKLLGADDYLIKPFNEEDLIAAISGKITRINRAKMFKSVIETPPRKRIFNKIPKSSIKDSIYILVALWDDKYGPKVIDVYPEKKEGVISIDQLVNQLFSAATSIYGNEKITKSEDLLLNLNNLNTDAYLFFDSYPDENERFREKEYMIAVLAPKINFFNSLEIKKVFHKLSKSIKERRDWTLSIIWRLVHKALQSEIID
jgi:DNA-binding response OmpR family regulator